jgi:hypothetical protein
MILIKFYIPKYLYILFIKEHWKLLFTNSKSRGNIHNKCSIPDTVLHMFSNLFLTGISVYAGNSNKYRISF